MAYDEKKLATLGDVKAAASRTKQAYEQKFAEVGGSLYESTKTDPNASDTSVIEAFFSKEHAPVPKKGDVFVVTTTVDETDFEQAAYGYNGSAWIAMTGNVDADQVGNKTKTRDGTAQFSVKGKSVVDVLTEIFSKKLQPTITAQPAVNGFSLTGAKAVEAGTKVAAAQYTEATLAAGSYKFGPATGVAASNWKVERVTNAGTEQIVSADAASLVAGSDDNGGAGFIIGDVGGENVVSSLKYRATATHGAGVTAKDNLGGDSDPVVKIEAGTKNKETAAYTPFRNYFYGATAEKPALDSAYIRSLTKSNKAYAAGTFTLSVPAGTKRVVIACITGKAGVKKVINETAMNADVTSTFVKSAVPVEGASGYTAQEYNVWVFEPAVPYENAATLKVTLG